MARVLIVLFLRFVCFTILSPDTLFIAIHTSVFRFCETIVLDEAHISLYAVAVTHLHEITQETINHICLDHTWICLHLNDKG